MPLLPWSEKLEIGIPEMDAQHQQWIVLINDLHEAVTQKRSESTVSTVIDGMLAYTHSHFLDEERLLQESGYPDYEGHKKSHDNFYKQLQSIKERDQQGHLILNIEVMLLLSSWLTTHIQQIDRQYAVFFQQKNGVD